MDRSLRIAAAALILLLGAGCSTTRVQNPTGYRTLYEDPGTVGRSMGMGVESQDVIGMTDQMVRDMLGHPVLAGRSNAPRVIVDAKYFRNSSAERLNKRMITNRLRVELNRAAQGRMVFVGRHRTDMIEEERGYKREGLVDTGALPLTRAPLGGDYRLSGEFASHDSAGVRPGERARYVQVTFEMIDLETGELVWSGLYEYRKASQAHVLYR